MNNTYKTINGKNIRIQTEKSENFNKTSRYLNNIEICTDIEYKDGSYDKNSRVFLADKKITVSSDYINYTRHRQQYNSKTNIYTDSSQAPLIDENGNIMGEQEIIEKYCPKNGETQINLFSIMDDESKNYLLETNCIKKGDQYTETSTLTINNRLSASKEKIQYKNENGKETYIYIEDGKIGQKIIKTDRGTSIEFYKNGQSEITYEYDENGKALVQMAGLKQIPEDYVKSCFEVSLPEYQIINHVVPDELYVTDQIDQNNFIEDLKAKVKTEEDYVNEFSKKIEENSLEKNNHKYKKSDDYHI